jgi:hypothetical protein
MAHWEHRIVTGKGWASVNEVYFTDDGKPEGYCAGTAAWGDHYGEDMLQSLQQQLAMMAEALNRPSIDENEFYAQKEG